MQQYMHMHAVAVATSHLPLEIEMPQPHIPAAQITLIWFLTLFCLILFIIVELNHVFVYDSRVIP